jgi:hypothetical protein
MTELQDLSPELISQNKDLEESQDLLAETVTNLESYNLNEEEGEIPQIIDSQKKRKKGRDNIFNYYIYLLTSQFHSSPLCNKILIIISLMIIISTLFIKLFMYYMMLSSLIKRIKKLREFIFNRILDDVRGNLFYNIINYFFLVIGFIIYFIEMFCQFIIRYKTLLTINSCSLKTLILSKCFFFISLGLIPEVIFANVPFKSKKNIFLSFYKMKLIIQPYILLVLIIYYLLFILCLGKGETQKEKIRNEIKSIKKAINGFVDKNIFVWNNFDEKDILIEEKKRKEEEMKKEEEKKNQIKESQKKDNELKRRKTVANFGTMNRLGTVQRKKRKESQDENEDKGIHEKFLGIKEVEDEDDENKEKVGIFTKIGNKIKIAKLFLIDNIFIRMKKYIIFGIIVIILLSPVINGIFGYGYYVFYDSQVDYCFQIDLALCFVYGFTLILLTNE